MTMAPRMLVWAIVALVLVACGGGGDGSGPRTLTKEDDGTTVEVTNGETFRITLDANVSIPFRWHLVTPPDAGVVEYVSSAYEASPNPERLVGSGGTSIWTFEATGAGTTTIGLASVEINDRPPKQPDFSVTIDVTG
jgi:inhibitor of cysteine peptidase